jgi:hypothetical protein
MIIKARSVMFKEKAVVMDMYQSLIDNPSPFKYYLMRHYNLAQDVGEQEVLDWIEDAFTQYYPEGWGDFLLKSERLRQDAFAFKVDLFRPQPSNYFHTLVDKYKLNHWQSQKMEGETALVIVDSDFIEEPDEQGYVKKCYDGNVWEYDPQLDQFNHIITVCQNNEKCFDARCIEMPEPVDVYDFIITIAPQQPYAGVEAMLWPYAIGNHCFKDVYCQLENSRRDRQPSDNCFDVKYYFTIDRADTYEVSCTATFEDGTQLTKHEVFEVVPLFDDNQASIPGTVNDNFEIKRVNRSSCQTGQGSQSAFWLTIFVLIILSRRKRAIN